VYGAVPANVSATLTSLLPGTIYYYRIKTITAYGTFYSQVDSFISTLHFDEIPNWDFEIWDTSITEKLSRWQQVGPAEKVASFDGGHAVKLATYVYGGRKQPGAVFYGQPTEALGGGGIPFTGRPDSVVAYLNYDIAPADTGMVLVILKRQGQSISENIFSIIGSTGNNFVRFSRPLDYQSLLSPDTMVVGFINSFNQDGNHNVNSVMSVDKVSFPGTVDTIPNADFENWQPDTLETARNWFVSAYELISFGRLFQKTTDSYSGLYALRINNPVPLQTAGIVMGAAQSPENNSPAFAIHHLPITVNGYFKYFPVGHDSLIVQLLLFSHDSIAAVAMFTCDSTVSQYQPFSAMVNYFPGFTQLDSASLKIYSTGWESSVNSGNTYVMIDAITFDALLDTDYVDTVVVSAIEKNTPQKSILIYPNPASAFIYIKAEDFSTDVQITITDIQGREVEQLSLLDFTNEVYALNISRYQPGIYILAAQSEGKLVSKKFIKVAP
jgi:hypothetical protein